MFSTLVEIISRNGNTAVRLFQSVLTAREISGRHRGARLPALRDGTSFLDDQPRSHILKQVARAIERRVIGISGLVDRVHLIPIPVVAVSRRRGGISRRTSP